MLGRPHTLVPELKNTGVSDREGSVGALRFTTLSSMAKDRRLNFL